MRKVAVWINIHAPDWYKAPTQHLRRHLRNLEIWHSEWSQALSRIPSPACATEEDTLLRELADVKGMLCSWRSTKIHLTSVPSTLLQHRSLPDHSSFVLRALNYSAQPAGGCHGLKQDETLENI